MWETFVRENDYRTGLELGEGPFSVRAVLLRDLAGTLDWPTQPGLTFMHELEGRIRVICGLDRSPILTEGNDALRDHVDAGSNDSVLLVWGPGEDTLQAAEEIRIRYTEASEGVPNETRQYRPDGSTDFERILPGPDRMYPDTDSPPTKVTTARVEGLRDVLAEAPWSREERYSKAGVPMETIHYLIRLGGADLVDRVVRTGADVRQACFLLRGTAQGVASQGRRGRSDSTGSMGGVVRQSAPPRSVAGRCASARGKPEREALDRGGRRLAGEAWTATCRTGRIRR